MRREDKHKPQHRRWRPRRMDFWRIPFLPTNYSLLRGLIAGFYLIASKKREGKSYMMVLAAALELAHGDKQVLMYMPGVKHVQMADLVESLGGSRYSVFERLHLLSRDEATHFWRYRGTWIAEWKQASKIQGTVKWEPIDYRAHGDKGCMYCIDEIAKIFPKTATNEDWQELTSYLDMSSKIPDVILGSTVVFKHVVADMRVKVDVLIHCTNLARLSRLGVRFTRGFWATWKENPELYSGGKGPTIAWSFTPFDQLVAEAYDTSAGDTMIGGNADKGERGKGVHVAWVIGIGLVVLSLMGYSPFAAWHVAKKLMGFVAPAAIPSKVATNSPTVSPAPLEPKPAAPRPDLTPRPVRDALAERSTPVPLPQRPQRIVSYSETNGQRIFRLADGRVLWNPAGVFDGRNLRLESGELCTIP